MSAVLTTSKLRCPVARPGVLGIAVVIAGLAGCALAGPTQPELTTWSQRIANGAIPAATVYGGGLYLPGHLACIVGQVEAGRAPWAGAYQAVFDGADGERGHVASPVAVLNVPGFYDDPNGFAAAVIGITRDADAVYQLALSYAISGDTSYAAPAAAILREWATTNNAVEGHDGALAMTEVGVGFILSAELLNGYPRWTIADSSDFRRWVRNVYLSMAAAPIRDATNNWGDWGSFGAIMADYYLANLSGLDSETVRLQQHIDTQIAGDGSLPAEVSRGPGSAIWYTYFALDPLTAAVDVIRNSGGPDLFRWTSPHGRSLSAALDHLLYMTTNASALGLSAPRWEDPWPADLFEAMGAEYGNASYTAYAAPKRPISYLGHHYAWTFPTLESAPITVCPVLGRAPVAATPRAPFRGR